MTVRWFHDGNLAMTSPPNEVIQSGSNTTLVIRNPQPSDAGIYQCVFNVSSSGQMLRRNISVNITGVFMCRYILWVQCLSRCGQTIFRKKFIKPVACWPKAGVQLVS